MQSHPVNTIAKAVVQTDKTKVKRIQQMYFSYVRICFSRS